MLSCAPPVARSSGSLREGDTARYAVCAASLACRLGAFRPALCYNKSMKQILLSSSGFGAEPHIDYRACKNFGPLYATNR